MSSHITTATQIGYDALLVDVECDTHQGLPSINIVGLGNKAIEEAKERLRSAINNCGLAFPKKKIVINLAPADIPKDGSAFDMPMAMSILVASDQVSNTENGVLKNSLFIGELSLDGKLRPVRGVISATEAAKKAGLSYIFLPSKNYDQANLINNIQVVPVDDLGQLVRFVQNPKLIPPVAVDSTARKIKQDDLNHVNFSDIKGQAVAKRALLIAAAGHHNILLNGPPGAGKTMMAKALISILSKPSSEEIVEITKLHSLGGETVSDIITSRPFRSPHHTTSTVALIGGGRIPIPGEISLAHRGILFLDELPEYSRSSIEALRQPLEDHYVHVARARIKTTFPANFLFVATQNPCPCGFFGDDNGKCTCSMSQIQLYQKKLSGPLLDRIDIHIFVKRVDHRQLLNDNDIKQNNSDLQAKVESANKIQRDRFHDDKLYNAYMSNRQIKSLAKINQAAKILLNQSADSLQLSARSYMKVIKVARTIADLENSQEIEPAHIAESLQYRYQPQTI